MVPNSLESTLQQYIFPSPAKRALAESSLKSFFHSANESELHRRAYFRRNIIFDVLPIRPREYYFSDIRAVCTKNFFFDAANGTNTPAQCDLQILISLKLQNRNVNGLPRQSSRC